MYHQLATRFGRNSHQISGREPLDNEALYRHVPSNGYCESFNGKLRDECLRQEIFYSLKEAQTVIALWQTTYNRVRPHSSLGYRPPAPISFPDLAFRLPLAAAMQ